MKAMIVAAIVVLGLVDVTSAYGTKYSVKVRADKRTDFSKIRTYTWMAGSPAFDKSIDSQIENDIDRELAALGLTRLAAEPCDAIVTYQAILRTDVDVKSKMSPITNLRREYPVGTVIVRLLDSRDQRELFRGRADLALASDPSSIRNQIQTAIVDMFARYPTRKR
jgi:uncharacterized protein DUF4136